MKLDHAFEGYWLARKRNLSAHTVRDYSTTFRRLQHYLGNVDVHAITAQQINEFLNHMAQKHNLANKTLCNYWVALSSFWSWAEHELKIPHIISHVDRPKYRRAQVLPYTHAEITALLKACDHAAHWNTRTGRLANAKRPTALRDKTIMITFVDTGLRVSELCALTRRDYNPDNANLHVRHGKGNKARTVFAGDTTQRHLWKYLATRDHVRLDDPLIATRTGNPLDRHTVRKLINRAGTRAGVANANCHRFRHTFAINFLRNGGSVLELQSLLGHEKMDTVRIYAQLAQTDLANAIQRASPADHWNL